MLNNPMNTDSNSPLDPDSKPLNNFQSSSGSSSGASSRPTLKYLPQPPAVRPQLEIEDLVIQRSQDNPGQQELYVRALPLNIKAREQYDAYLEEGLKDEEYLVDQARVNEKELGEITRDKDACETRKADLDSLKTLKTKELDNLKITRGKQVIEFQVRIAPKALGRVDPSQSDFIQAIYNKFGAGELLSLRTRRAELVREKTAALRADKNEVQMPAPQLVEVPQPKFPESPKWEAFVFAGIALVCGSMTAISFTNIFGIRHSQAVQFEMSPALALAMVFGTMLVAIIGSSAEKLAKIGLEELREKSRISRGVLIGMIAIAVFVLVEAIGDGVGLNIVATKSMMRTFSSTPPIVIAAMILPLALLISCPPVVFKVFRMWDKAQAFGKAMEVWNEQKTVKKDEHMVAVEAQKRASEAKINSINAQLELIDGELQDAGMKQDKIDDFISRWDPGYVKATEVLMEIEAIDESIAELMRLIADLENQIRDIKHNIEMLKNMGQSRDRRIQVPQEMRAKYERKVEAIQQLNRDVMRALNMA